MTLRIAAIGCGDIAQRRHFPDIAAMGEEVQLVAIAGRDPGRVQACAERFGVPKWYTDPAAMLADPDIDAVLILTPPDSHGEHAAMAVRAGKHVLVEKPMVTSVAQARALTQAVRTQNAKKPIVFHPLPQPATPELDLVRALIAAGVIGEVTGVECHRGHRGPTHASWFYDRGRAGGGVLMDLGIYGLTMIATLFGPALRMTASCTRRFDLRTMDDGSLVRPDVEDSALLTLQLANGIAASLTASWNGCLSHHETRMRTVVSGRAGMLHFGVADRAVYVFRPDGTDAPSSAAPGPAALDIAPSCLAPSEASVFDGLACRRYVPDQHAPTASIIAGFAARIAAGDVSTRALDIQAHVFEIIAAAYQPERAGVALQGF